MPRVDVTGVLHVVEGFAHVVETHDAKLKVVGEFLPDRCVLLRRVIVALRRDRVRSFAGFDVIDEEVSVMDHARCFDALKILGEESTHEQGEVSDVLVYFLFPFEGRRIQKDIGFIQHFADCSELIAMPIANGVYLVGIHKLQEHLANI